jgi:DNA recombination-dependent growth factor C
MCRKHKGIVIKNSSRTEKKSSVGNLTCKPVGYLPVLKVGPEKARATPLTEWLSNNLLKTRYLF